MIYLDNAATTQHKPQCVTDAVCSALQRFGSPGRGAHAASMEASSAIFDARAKVAQLFGASGPDRVAFCTNATEALNDAINGLLKPGDHVVTTMAEHNSVLRPLYRLEEQGIISLTIVALNDTGYVTPAAVQEALQQNTRAVVCTHGSNVTGNVMDIQALGALCKQAGVTFIVDAAQTAGLIPLNMEIDNIGILCFTGHKSLYGPQGTGGIVVASGLNLKPLVVGGSGFDSFNHNHPTVMPEVLEAGTINAHGIAGLAAGIGYVVDTGIDTLRTSACARVDRFVNGVQDIEGVKLYGDLSAPLRTPVVSLNIANLDSGVVSDALNIDYDICTRAGAHCAPLMHQALGTQEQGAVRFSFSAENTAEEVDIAVRALAEISQAS